MNLHNEEQLQDSPLQNPESGMVQYYMPFNSRSIIVAQK